MKYKYSNFNSVETFPCPCCKRFVLTEEERKRNDVCADCDDDGSQYVNRYEEREYA